MDVYIDEAGTDHGARTVVVAAVMINPLKQAKAVDEEIARVIASDARLRDRPKFYFHAKDIVNDRALSRQDQQEIICLGIDVALSCGLTVAMTLRSKESVDEERTARVGRTIYTAHDNEACHAMAFIESIYVANAIVEAGYSDQIMSIFAEDCPQMRKKLRAFVRVLLQPEKRIQIDFIKDCYSKGFDHVRNGVNFCEKGDSPSLQIADLFAFGYSRFLLGGPDGQLFMHHMRGRRPPSVIDQQSTGRHGFFVFNYGSEQFPILDLKTPMMRDPHWGGRDRG